jgi:DNA transformation protein
MLDADWLTDLFSPFGTVRVRRLFGGQGVYLDGLIVGLVADGVLYLKCDEETVPEFEAAGLAPFVYSARGRTVALSYRKAPSDVLENPDALAPWVGLARQAAVRAVARKGGAGAKRPARPKAVARRR